MKKWLIILLLITMGAAFAEETNSESTEELDIEKEQKGLSLFSRNNQSDDVMLGEAQRDMESNVTIVLSRLTSEDKDTQRRSSIYTEELKTALVNIASLDIKTAARQEGVESELSKEEAIALGLEMEADFVIYGTVTETDQMLTFYLYMVSPRTGIDLLGEPLRTTRDLYVYELSRQARKIEQATIIASEEALEYVQTYMDYKNWQRAYDVMQNYIKLKETNGQPLHEREISMNKEIKINLAEYFFNQAQNFLEARLYLEAQIANKRSLDFNPENSEYMDQQLEIEKAMEVFRREQLDNNLQTVKDLFQRGDFITASIVLKGVEDLGQSSVEISALRINIDNKLQSIIKFDQAKDAYRSNDMEQALFLVEEARKLDPLNKRILDLQQDIYVKAEIQKENEALWQSYVSEMDEFNPFNLFRLSKKPLHLETVSFHSDILSWQLSSAFSLSNESLTLRGISLSEHWFFRNPLAFMDLPFQFASIRPYAAGSISGSWIQEDSAVMYNEYDGFNSLISGMYLLSLSGGINLQFFSFSINGGVTTGLGVYNNIEKYVYPLYQTENSKESNSRFARYLGLECGFAWYPTERIQFQIGYANSLYGDSDLEHSRIQKLDVGIGIRMY